MNADDCTILIVEDEPVDVLMIRRAMSKARVANPIQVVEDGDAAVAYLSGAGEYVDRRRYPLPMLILLDLKLPRRSGLEVLEWRRQQPGLRRIPVVVLTSSREAEDVRRAYDTGANSYLVKPVQFDALLEMVKSLGTYWLILNEPPSVEA